MSSISQRGINPNWRPPPEANQRSGQANLGIPGRRPVQQQRDILLNSNPDFELSDVARGGRIPGAMAGQQGQAF